MIQTYFKPHWSTTVRNTAVENPMDFIDFKSWLLKSAGWVKVHPSSSLHTLRANSIAQQNQHFWRELIYSLIVTMLHTAVMVVSKALLATGKKVSLQSSDTCNCVKPRLCYRCFYIGTAVLDAACSQDCICTQPKWISSIPAPLAVWPPPTADK